MKRLRLYGYYFLLLINLPFAPFWILGLTSDWIDLEIWLTYVDVPLWPVAVVMASIIMLTSSMLAWITLMQILANDTFPPPQRPKQVIVPPPTRRRAPKRKNPAETKPKEALEELKDVIICDEEHKEVKTPICAVTNTHGEHCPEMPKHRVKHEGETFWLCDKCHRNWKDGAYDPFSKHKAAK